MRDPVDGISLTSTLGLSRTEALCTAPLAVVLDTEWLGCPEIWVWDVLGSGCAHGALENISGQKRAYTSFTSIAASKKKSKLTSLESPEEAVIQLPENSWGISFCGIHQTKNVILEWHCATQGSPEKCWGINVDLVAKISGNQLICLRNWFATVCSREVCSCSYN